MNYVYETLTISEFVFICRRLRAYEPKQSPFQFVMDSINVVDSQALLGKMINSKTNDVYNFTIQFLEHSTVRFQLNEETVYRPRFHPRIGLAGEPSPQKLVCLYIDYLIVDSA